MKRCLCLLAAMLVLLVFSSCSLFRPATDLAENPPNISPSATDDAPSPLDPNTTDDSSPGETTSTPDTTDDTTEVPVVNVPDDPETPLEETTVSFVGAGDNLIFYGNVRDAASCAVSGGRKYNFAPTYDSVRETIQSADIAFINQESLMCGDGYAFSYYPRFNGPQDLAYDLADVGFDVINIANNHMLDKGTDGLEKTIDF